nr:mediator of RNA polymerase II transcription subunit 14-like [Cherax quadricarinatus]
MPHNVTVVLCMSCQCHSGATCVSPVLLPWYDMCFSSVITLVLHYMCFTSGHVTVGPSYTSTMMPNKPYTAAEPTTLTHDAFHTLCSPAQMPTSQQVQQIKWSLQWCLTNPPIGSPIAPPGMFIVVVSCNKILFFFQLTRINVQLPPETEPPNLMLPLVYDSVSRGHDHGQHS